MTITLQQHATSPLRSSPLSKPPWPPTKPANKRQSAGLIPSPSPSGPESLPIPRREALPPSSPAAGSISTSPTATCTSAASAASAASASPLSRSHPLLGSYHLSLLHSRMSAHAPHSVPSFSLRLKAVATPKCPSTTPAAVRCPPPLDVAFKATYYDLADGVNTPWVADVDLEAWFMSAYGGERRGSSSSASNLSPSHAVPASPIPASASSPTSTTPRLLPPPPHYPGYRVPPVGQLQILVRTPTAALKVFVIPYDLRALPVDGRLLARERTYVSCSNTHAQESNINSSICASGSGSTPSPQKSRETLRYAVQLQFTCTPAPPDERETDDTARAFYVARTLKLVFASRAPDSSDHVRDERADELVPPPSGSPVDRADDWAPIRQRYLAATPPSAGTRRKSSSSRHRPPAAAIRGFSPSRERPSTPAAIASPRSLLSALDPRDDANERSTTPTPPGGPHASASLGAVIATALLAPTPHHPSSMPAPAADAALNGTGSVTSSGGTSVSGTSALARAASPRPPSVLSDRRRRGSGAERELSKRLRTLELRHTRPKAP